MNDSEKTAANATTNAAADAGDSFAAWIPSAEERYDMIEVAAYHIAERSGFRTNPQECWAAAEEHVNLMLDLRESKKKLQTLVDTALDAVVMMDSEGRITGWNRQAERIFGWTRSEIMGRTIHATIIPLRHRGAHADGLKHFLASGEGPYMNRMIEAQALHRDGREFPVELAIAVMITGGQPEFSAFIRDITERKRAEAELRSMATTDFLTGLANRRHFIERMSDELARLQRLDQLQAAVLMLDLDYFKHVNDTHGHATGDALLKHVASLMRGELRRIDTVARVGGEEFAIILPGADVDEARILAERVRQKVGASPLTLGESAVLVSVSIGIAVMRTNDGSADAALIRADEALYRAKSNGRDRVEVAA